MLIKINQAIKGAGSFTWHVLIPDEGDIRKHFYGSVKKKNVKWQIKKRRRENYDYSPSWVLLSKQIGVISKTFVMETFLIRFAVYSTATAKKVSNAFLFFTFWFIGMVSSPVFLLVKIILHFFYYCFFFHMGNEL